MIEDYLRCPANYKRKHIDGIREKTSSSAMSFGTAMHTALKAHFDGEDPYMSFNMYWNSLKDEHLEYDRFSWEDLGAMAVDTFLPNFLRLHAKHIEPVRMEETLTMPILGEHTLQGTYDIVANVDGVLTMIDYKTSAKEYPKSKIYRNPQLYIYAALYKHTYGVMPQQIMYKVFIKTEKRIQSLKINLTEESLQHNMNNVTDIVEDIVNRKKFYCNYQSCFCPTPRECFK